MLSSVGAACASGGAQPLHARLGRGPRIWMHLGVTSHLSLYRNMGSWLAAMAGLMSGQRSCRSLLALYWDIYRADRTGELSLRLPRDLRFCKHDSSLPQGLLLVQWVPHHVCLNLECSYASCGITDNARWFEGLVEDICMHAVWMAKGPAPWSSLQAVSQAFQPFVQPSNQMSPCRGCSGTSLVGLG